MLERLRNKRVVFVGDSIGRNQWESLLCMLSTAVPDKSFIYEINGRPITKHDGFFIFKFRDYNCTVEYYRSPFLVPQGHGPAGAPKFVKSTVRVDSMDWMSGRRLHLYTRGAYFQEGNEVKMNMSVSDAYRRSIKTLFDWLQKNVNANKTQAIFRTYSPTHFSGGDWNSGGFCQQETLPDMTPFKSLEQWADMLKPVNDVLGSHHRPRLPGLDILNVTRMTAQRKDGHLSVFRSPLSSRQAHTNKTSEIKEVEDCSHWCLPGVPDVWNELLYTLFMKRQIMLEQTMPPFLAQEH
ncbi:unnamed protein product [Triticum turgidum subsp. durum]|uniref:Trichome birefringence-like C-terminal domain-containing protein n=1 Tax=Triticum turgidum subsp. durum TaxID=4567 RepID=A0A9R1NZF9_TRITD|nr:unnamed protein product [Triticum turgidum subsp. durum]